MCIVCADWQKGKLTLAEARRNLIELMNSNASQEEQAHYFEFATTALQDSEAKDDSGISD